MVALVVTVVVLLILAGITLMYVLGEDNIFKEAQDAKDQTQAGIDREKEDMGNLVNLIRENKGDGSGNGGTTNPPDTPDVPEVPKGPNGKPLVSTVTDTNHETIKVEDKNGNGITIPNGFRVVPNSPEGTDASEKVAYTYNGDGTPAVQDGIVIEDDKGNQFVWIPVGEIKNKKDDTRGPTTTITLGRYTFNIGTYDSTNQTWNGGTGKETLVQSADNYASTANDTKINNYYQELETSSYGNTVANSLSTFVSKTKTNGGYYLARYEASYKDDAHCYSKVSTATREDENTTLTSGMLWNYITQPDAATVARNSFSNGFIESDLVNSYSWDTAIVFIQTYSGDNDYSKELGSTFSSSLSNTGTNGDNRCNIYDMASNTSEWTTETCTYGSGPCNPRGGYFGAGYYHTAIRSGCSPSKCYVNTSFRLLFYVI